MPERINKFQPDRTIALRGFDSFAAAAAIHSATPNGFKVSGTFRDPADFAVAVLYDADNFYEHPSIKYLPDFDFSGSTLNFDLRYSNGLQPIDSPKFNWIDWATLDCIKADEDSTVVRLQLWDYATLASPSYPAASATCTLSGAPAGTTRDSVTLWYQNLAFEAAGTAAAEFAFFATDGKSHRIAVNGVSYPHLDITMDGESSGQVADALIRTINADGSCPVSASFGSAGHIVKLTVKTSYAGMNIPVSADGSGGGAATLHLITPESAAAEIAAQINAANWISAGAPHALIAEAAGASVVVTAARYGSVEVVGNTVRWLSHDQVANLRVPQAVIAGPRFAGLSAGSPVWIGGQQYSIQSVDSLTQLTLNDAPAASAAAQFVAVRGGSDANGIVLNALNAPGSGVHFGQTQYPMSGGSSDVTWRISLDLSALGISQLRQCWLTFAPSLVTGPYSATEWEAAFSNWTLSGDPDKCALKIAGPGSVRIEETDKACVYAGSWAVPEPIDLDRLGFFSKYFVQLSKTAGSSVTVTYNCQSVHDLYVGTALYQDYAKVHVQVDSDSPTDLNCKLKTGSPINTRRRARQNVAPGRHVVTLTLTENADFFFDFLEAAVVSDFSDALTPRTGISPAIDFDTDHAYKLPPARLMWMFDKLGYAGPMNEYLGVFWWNQRVRPDAVYSTATIDFAGPFVAGDSIVVRFNGTLVGKSIFAGDDENTIAQHFATYINGAFVGAWAQAQGPSVTVMARSPVSVYDLDLTLTTAPANGTVLITTTVPNGHDSIWIIDDTQASPMNRATKDWHTDFFAQCHSRERDVATACSLELVFPPDGYTAKYPDGTPVTTDTGFGVLKSHHCAAGSPKMIAYQKKVYRQIADLQAAAGLRPWVQFGEFLWWYFEQQHGTGGGMAFYDDDTKAAALQHLGRDLFEFSAHDDDPSLHLDDAVFVRNRLRNHVAALAADVRSAHPTTRCEVLWAYDVNYPARLPGGNHDLGGRLNLFVNLPVEWQRKETSGLDAMKVEALAFGTGFRNLDMARETIQLFPNFGWPLDSVRYLVPIFSRAIPWHRELALAREAGIAECNLWAFDHICLYNLDVPERVLDRRSVVKTG